MLVSKIELMKKNPNKLIWDILYPGIQAPKILFEPKAEPVKSIKALEKQLK